MILAVFEAGAGLVVRQVNVIVKTNKVSDTRANQGGLWTLSAPQTPLLFTYRPWAAQSTIPQNECHDPKPPQTLTELKRYNRPQVGRITANRPRIRLQHPTY